MGNKLYEETDIKAIADAIRSKTGSSDTYSAAEMANAVSRISSGDCIAHGDVPDYVKKAALETAKKVESVRTDDSIVFLTVSDPHHAAREESGWRENINTGNLHCAMAAKALAYAIPFDFVAMLGDLTYGSETTDKDFFIEQCEEYHGWMDEAFKDIPQFWTPGNHDTGEYYARNTGDLSNLYGAELIFRYFGSRCGYTSIGNETYGYGYRDFDDKKLRVICLNTSEGETTMGENSSYFLSDSQLLWFAQTLSDVGGKPDAPEWGIIVLSHYPLDWGRARSAGRTLDSYLGGGFVSLCGTTVNFSGKNNAKFIGNFHGHIHNFLADKIYYVPEDAVSDSSLRQIDALRIASPCGCFYRSNECGKNSGTDSNYIEFGENVTYDKVIGCAEDTAFTVNVASPLRKKIYSFCYGAGYDRALCYDFTATNYSVTNILTNCSTSNGASLVSHGDGYAAALTPDPDCSIDEVIVSMGGADITSSAYTKETNSVSIGSVTGDVVVSASAIRSSAAITMRLTNVTSSNNASSAVLGSSYRVTLTPTLGKLSVVIVMMNGENVTPEVFNAADGVVIIPRVTGDILIKATGASYTNLVPSSQDLDGSDVYNATGYKNSAYISSANGMDGSKSGHVSTGCIAYPNVQGGGVPPTVYVKGGVPDRIAGFLEGKTFKSLLYNTVATERLADDYYKIVPVMREDGNSAIYFTYGRVKWLRLDCVCQDGAELIVTFDEPIE